jgi:hypothetical protein
MRFNERLRRRYRSLATSSVKQRILISVLPIDASKSLLDAARQRLESGSLGEHIRSLIERNQVIFYCEHLDLWSMGDTFERFLRPKKHLLSFSAHSSILYAIPRERLRLSAPARDAEEQLLRDLLGRAKRAYQRTVPGSFLFVLRTVFGASGDDDFSNGNQVA